MTLGALTVMTTSAELVENGNFAKGAAHWDLAVPDAYGPPPVVKITRKTLELSQMQGASMGYLTLNQAVNIENNKHYTITFEAKGVGKERFLVAVHDPGEEAHVSKLFEIEESWQTHEIEFVGSYETDHRWVRQWIRATRKNRLEGGRTVGSSLHEVDDPKADGPIRTYLTIALGEIRGSFSIRNISIVETAPGRPSP